MLLILRLLLPLLTSQHLEGAKKKDEIIDRACFRSEGEGSEGSSSSWLGLSDLHLPSGAAKSSLDPLNDGMDTDKREVLGAPWVWPAAPFRTPPGANLTPRCVGA